MQNEKLQQWYDEIHAYLRLMYCTNIYCGLPPDDVEYMLKKMGFSEVFTSWYDGILFDASRGGYRFGSGWCTKSHNISTKNFTWYIAVHENTSTDQFSDELLERENNYKYATMDGELFPIPVRFYELQTALIELCKNLGDEFGVDLRPRFILQSKHKELEEL